MCKEPKKMGTRNRAFEIEGDEETRNAVHEIPTISKQSHTDGPQLSKFAEKISGLDINSFATRKTLAQGLLDLALLTANAAQLRRVMLQGNEFRFYYLLVTLITISICLQVVQAIIMCILAIVFDLNNFDQHRKTNIANNILLMFTIISVAVNIVISTFDLADIK